MAHIADNCFDTAVLCHRSVDQCMQIVDIQNGTAAADAAKFIGQINAAFLRVTLMRL